MRNLKKFLALVLAMMMAFSLMITANASYTADSDFSDAESLTPEFREAVSVLEGLEVFEGYEDGTFKPKNNITRAEVATIVYRLATGDVKGTQANLYKDYATFTDVKADHWAAGYINYCANAEWISGYGNGKFGPNDQVTGYQAASMILRAVGYGKNKEFVGSGWQVQTANFSRTLGLLDNVDDTTYANTLNQAAPRELVAEILFQAGLIDTVTWTPMFGYTPGSPVQGISVDNGLAWQNFKLNVGNWTYIDKWGRPGYYWYKNTNTAANRVATIELESDLDFNTAWKECDVAHELGFDGSKNFDLYVNNYARSTGKYRIESTDTVTRVGGQGRITEIYAYGGAEHPWEGLYNSTNKGDLNQRVVMIDTYLAKVTRVTERVLDRQGHVVTPAYLYLDVYDGHGVGPAAKAGVFFASGSAAKVNTSTHRLEDKDANWAYVAGDMVLVRGYSDPNQWEDVGATDSGDGATSAAEKIGYTFAGPAPGNVVGLNDARLTTDITGLNHVATQALIEEEAFENNCLLPSGADYANDVLDYEEAGSVALEVVGKAKTQKADMKTGKQTVTYWSEDKHTVDGTDYNDAMTLYLDVAGTTAGTTFAWYFDEFNNIIGIDNVPNTINYGVITSIYSAFGQGEGNTDGTAKAVANVLYANGSTGTLTIDKFLMGATVDAIWNVTRNTANGANVMNGTAFDAANAVTGNTLDLVPVYDNSQANVMKSSGTRAGAAAANQGWLHVAPVTNVNAIENGSLTGGYFGVLRGNLFKFVTSGDNTVTAVEVAGDGVNGNTGVYAGHGNNTASANGAKLFKNAAYIDVDTSAPVANDTVRLDTNAVIMVRASATSTAVACYNLDTLPGDVTLASGTEVDWADTTGNGRANYVYVTGTSQGSLTYGLFYYNGGAAQWNGVDKTGTLFGWLNGEPTTLTFIGETSFTGVRDSQSYLGHLFAVEMTNGVVTKVMAYTGRGNTLLGTSNGNTITSFGPVIPVSQGGTAGNIRFVDSLGNQTEFLVGTANGNPYNASTEAVYLRDSGTGATDVSYDPSYSAIAIGGTNTYYLNANSKVVGLGMGVTEDTAILDYLNKSTTNDVTIVYDSNSKAIVEIYVATDPNVTPSTPTTYAAVIGSNGTTAQTSGIDLASTSIKPAANTYITRNGVNIGNATVKVTARVEMLTSSGYVYVGSYDWNETVTAGALGVVGKTTGVSLVNGATYRINATVYNATIGTLPIAVDQVITTTT